MSTAIYIAFLCSRASRADTAGASGGGVFNALGELSGLVTSNTKHASSGRNFAKLNYSIAAAALIPILTQISTRQSNEVDWASLDVHSIRLSQLWDLKGSPPVLSGSIGRSHGSQRLRELLENSAITNKTQGHSDRPPSKL